jgi:hypothetical protein
LTKNGLGYILGNFFRKTHQVTLLVAHQHLTDCSEEQSRDSTRDQKKDLKISKADCLNLQGLKSQNGGLKITERLLSKVILGTIQIQDRFTLHKITKSVKIYDLIRKKTLV